MIRILLATSALFLPYLAPPAQELKADVLDHLKSATVYVVVGQGRNRATGSGFLFLSRGTKSYLLTCAHVVESGEPVKVVFWSGLPKEVEVEAQVMAVDPGRDLACLAVTTIDDPPKPLSLGEKTEVRETETVFAAGFPFGAGLTVKGAQNPEISISKSSVSSIRRTPSGDVAVVQVSGEINPGNSGGPLIAGDGKVLGVNAAKISGTGTAFAIPPESIQQFLRGGIRECTLRRAETPKSPVEFDVVIDLINPLRELKGAGIAFSDRGKVGEIPKDGDDTSWEKIDPALQEIDLMMERVRATGRLTIPDEPGSPVERIIYQCYVIGRDGRKRWTAPRTHRVKPASGDGEKRRPPAAPKPPVALDDDEPPDPKLPPPSPAVKLRLPKELAIATQLKVNSVFGGLILAPDGAVLYALDLSEGLLYKIDPDSLAVSAKVGVHPGSVSLALTPDGTKLLVAGSRILEASPESPAGLLQVISTESLRQEFTISTTVALSHVVATERDTAVASTARQGLVFLDLKTKQSSLERFSGLDGGPHLRLGADQKRIYAANEHGPGAYYGLLLWKKKGAYPLHRSPDTTGGPQQGGYFELTPDGRFLVGGRGAVLRLAKSPSADLQLAGMIDPCQSIALAPGSDTFFTFTASGLVNAYSFDELDAPNSAPLGHHGERAVLDPRRRKIHVILSPLDRARSITDTRRTGRLSSLALSEP